MEEADNTVGADHVSASIADSDFIVPVLGWLPRVKPRCRVWYQVFHRYVDISEVLALVCFISLVDLDNYCQAFLS